MTYQLARDQSVRASTVPRCLTTLSFALSSKHSSVSINSSPGLQHRRKGSTTMQWSVIMKAGLLTVKRE